MSLPLFVVDAFTGRPFGGNPAAVVLLGEFRSDAVLQAIAAENNLSETAFVVRRGPARWDIRWFTHSALRTRYREVGGELTGFIQDAARPDFVFTDLSASHERLDPGGELSLLDRWAYADLPLNAECLLGCKVIQFGDHALVALRTPHFVGDAISAEILFAEFSSLYRAKAAGEEPRLAPLKLDFAGYVQKQGQSLADGGWDKSIPAWRTLYAGLAVLHLRPEWRSADRQGVRGDMLFALDRAGLDGFFAMARVAACPPEIAIFAVIAKILGEWLELDDFIHPTVNRGRFSIEEMGVVGLFIMDLGIPIEGAKMELRELMAALFKRWIELNRHGALPALIALHEVMGERHSAVETNILVDFSAQARGTDKSEGAIRRVPYSTKIENAPERSGMYVLVHGNRDRLVCQLYRSASAIGDEQAERLRGIAAAVVADFAPVDAT